MRRLRDRDGSGLAMGTVAISVSTLGVKAIAAAKELAIAYRFGRGDEVDAFVMAFLFPAFAANVVAASLAMVLVPPYLEAERNQGEAAARRFLENWLVVTLVTLVCAVPVVASVASFALPVLAPSFDAAKVQLTRSLILALAPYLIAVGLGGFFGAQLNARGRFLATAVVPAVTPLITVLLVLAAGGVIGIRAVAIATTAGAVVEAFVLWFALRRLGGSVRPRWHGLDAASRRTLGQLAHVVVGAMIGSAQNVVDNACAAYLGTGAPAALAYAAKLPALVVGLASGAWLTAFPFYARQAAAGDKARLWTSVRRHSAVYAGLAVPVTIALIVASRPLTRLLFERGAFGPADTELVARVQAFYLVQIPFYILYMLLSRLLTAMNASHVVARGAVLYLACDVVFNIAFMKIWGVAGIALSTSCVIVVSFGYVAFAARRLLRETHPGFVPHRHP